MFRESTLTDAERAAGIERISSFGILNSIDTLAGGDVFKYDAATELPYHLAIAFLYRHHEIALYRKRLRKVLEPKPQTK